MTTLLILVALLAVADRASAVVAGRVLAGQLQTSGALAARPEVSLRGVPFLTQALSGTYDRIEVRATGVPAGEVTVDLDVELTKVQVPLGDLVSGSVTQVPVGQVRAEVLLPYAEMSRRSGDRQLVVSQAGNQVRVTGSVRVLGQTFTGSAVSTVTLEGDQVVVTAQSYEVGNTVANAVVSRALGGLFDLRFAVDDLPYDLVVQSVEVGPDGVAVRADATQTVLVAP